MPFSLLSVAPFVGPLQVHTFSFSNGLRLKVVPDATAPVVAYQTWFRVGSADEVKGKTGLAHLFEHLMFKATEGYTDGEYMARLEAMGADGLNAWTWLDQTVYLQAVPKERLEDVAGLESMRMHQLLVEEGPFRSELDVVMNERRLVVDNEPSGQLSERLFATAFEAHPYGVPTIGWMEDLEKMNVEDAQAFYRRFYAPDNATIVIVGDVHPEQAAQIVERHYGHLKPATPDRTPRPVEPEQLQQKRLELTLPIAADRVLIGFKIPGYTDPDIPALLVLDAALTAGQTGRLQRALCDAGFVADVSASVIPLRQPSLFEFSFTVRPGISAEAAEGEFWAELARIREEGVSEGEWRMGIAQWESSTLAQLEEALGKGSMLGWLMTHTGDEQDGLRRIEAIRQVSLEDLRRVAAKYLVPERSTVAVGRSDSPAPELPVPERNPVAASALASVRSRAIEPASFPAGELLERQVAGAKVILIHDPALPLVHFRLAFPAGSAADPDGKGGLANLTGRMLLRGTRSRDRQDFEGALEQLGASVSVSVDADGMLLSGTSLASTWPSFAELVREAVTEPKFDAADLEQLVKEVDDELATRGDDDGELAGIALRERLYGEKHPYGRDPRGTRRSIAGLSPEDLRAFHSAWIRAGGAVVGIAGGFDGGVLRDLERLLEAVPGETPKLPQHPVPAVSGRRLVLVDKPERTQAQVVMGHTGVNPRASDFHAVVLANDAFGVGFGGRLFQEIRVKKGWSYYAYSTPQIQANGGAFLMGMAPGNAVAVDAVARMVEVAESTDREGFSPEEIQRVRNARLNGRPFLASSARKRLDLAMRNALVGYDRAAATEKMATTTAEDANAAFCKMFRPEDLVVAMVCTGSEVLPALQERFGAVEVVPFQDLVRD